MAETIHTGSLSATIDTMGAQLTSLRLDGNEYLWQGDPRWWKNRAPVLFPIVGSLRNGLAKSAAGPCVMGRHGIARNLEHQVVERASDDTSVTFELRYDDQTLKAYPYRFRLNMEYSLEAPATLSQTYIVTNEGDVPMPFSVGGHPAFNIPVPTAPDEAFEDYVVRFTRPWTCVAPVISLTDGLASYADSYTVIDGTDALPITRRALAHDAIVLTDVPDSTLSLVGTKSGHGIRMDFPGFKFLGIWSPAADSPFIALEPWTGLTTLDTEDDVFEHKLNITMLEPHGTYALGFRMTLL